MDWLDLLAVQGTLKSLLQPYNQKALIVHISTFFMVQLSHPQMITGKTIALIIQTFVGKVMSLLFNTLSRFVIVFHPRSKKLCKSQQIEPASLNLQFNVKYSSQEDLVKRKSGLNFCLQIYSLKLTAIQHVFTNCLFTNCVF